MAGDGDLEQDEFDHETESSNLLDELAEDVSEDVILENGETRFLNQKNSVLRRRRTAKGYLRNQHPSCHQAWKFYLQHDGRGEDGGNTDYDLLDDLGAMARRYALNLSLTLEANRGNFQTKNKMLEVRRPFLGLSVIFTILDAVGTFCDCV
jgi:hypothetical protein